MEIKLPQSLELQKIKDKLSTISTFYLSEFEKDLRQQQISLLGGRGSTILLQALLYKSCFSEEKYKEALEANVNFLIDRIEESDKVSPTFCDGLAGVGWLLIHLNQHHLIEINEDDFFDDIDQYLRVEMDLFIESNYYDIMHGALGIGLYFLKRGKMEVVEKLITTLAESCISDSNEIKWRRFDRYHLKDYILDFGLAHGNAGYLYFLGKCFQKGIMQDTCLHLIKGNVAFYFNNIQNIALVGSYFDSSILLRDYCIGNNLPRRSRLAWCYGDLGILHTMLLISLWTGDFALNEKVTHMLIKLSERRAKGNTALTEADFCHGMSGVGYIYLNIYKLTGNIIFLETANHWLRQTYNLSKENHEEMHGYTFDMGEEGQGVLTGLLTGLAGVGAFMVSSLDENVPQDWNECLFLS